MQPETARPRTVIKDVLQKTTLFFREKGFESARLDTEMLIASALKWERMKLYLNYEYPLSPDELTACRELVRRRSLGEPVAYILGRKDFYNHSFIVNPAVLIPRPETEQIVEEATAWMRANVDATGVVDLGTGSGCIGLSILSEIASAYLVAVDVSAAAVAVGAANAEQLGLAERAKFICADVAMLATAALKEAAVPLSAASRPTTAAPPDGAAPSAVDNLVAPDDRRLPFADGLADVIVANPPYIAENDPAVETNVKRFEPRGALFSGADGLEAVRAWAARAIEMARPGAFVMFEIGHEQGSSAREIFMSLGQFRDIQVVKDMSGRDRFIRAWRA